jgi:cupin 2 domain-containing protein
MNNMSNILKGLPSALTNEVCETLAESDTVRIERIVSRGQTTAEGEWFDQDQDEWVLVMSGSADLLFEDDPIPCRMGAGDFVMIPAHRRHRVAWTVPETETVWLAIYGNFIKTS